MFRRRKLSARARRYWSPVAVLAVVNFVAFFAVAVSIGGDALSGKAEGGRYYLSNHGVLTEVSPAVYTYSSVHTVSILVTHGVTVGWALVLLARGEFYEARPPNDIPDAGPAREIP